MKLSLKSFWQEFKGFAFKGNMIDLAVAVVIGGAFTGVINSLVGDIIMPAISYVTTAAHEVTDTATDLAHEATGHGKSPEPAPPSTTQSSASQPVTPPPPPTPLPPAPAATPASPTQAVNFAWKIGRFEIGHFVASLINFMIVAFAVFLMMVKLLGSVVKRASQSSQPSEPTTKECPECLSIIPYKAKRCSQCTAVLTTVKP